MIVESRPWVLGQSLTHTNGLLYVATGTGSYKEAAPEEVVVELEPIRQEHFYPGDVLPDWMIDEVQVCLIDGTLVDVYDTEQLPENVNGMVIVDAVTGMPTFNQKPVKLEDQRQTVYGVGDTLPEWMVGKVNVCLLVTGEVVELCDDEAVPYDIDGTVIVDALTGVPTYNQGAQKPVPVVKPIVSQLDEPTKEDVESGVCIWRNESDGCLYTVTVEDDGSCTWFSSDKNDTNTFATVIEAPAAGVDDYNNQYSASQDLIVFADDSIMAMTVDTDTVDGYSEQGVSDGSQLDAKGDPIPAGNDITTYYDSDGVEINSKDNSDEWSESITLASGDAYPRSPTLAGTCSKVLDSAGNLMGTVDDDGPHPIQHPNYITQTLCAPDGARVIAKRDIDSLVVVYYLQDGSVYAGDISALEECPDLGISKRCSDGEEIVLGETSLVTEKEVEPSRWVNPLPFPATVYAQHGSPEECGTRIVCGPEGLVGSPEHTAYCENIIVNASWNLLNESYADWQAANGGAALGQSGVIKYDDEMQSWTNPHPCRRVMVEIAHGWERWAVIQRAGTSGSIVKVLEVDGGNTIGINDANANNATESDEFQQIWGLGGQYAAPCVILEPGETVEFRHRVYWYWGAPTVSAIPTALVYGLSGAKVEYRIKAWTI